MRLARKLILALVLVIAGVLALAGWLELRRGLANFEADMRRDTLTLATTLADSSRALWHAAGPDAAVLLVESSNWREDDFLIRWVWLDEPIAAPFTDFVPRAVVDQLRAGRTAGWREAGDDGRAMLHSLVPVRNPGPRPAAIDVGLLYDRRDRYRRDQLLEQLVTSTVLVAVCAVVAALLGLLFVGRPVRALVEHARRVGAGDFTSRSAVAQQDEIGQLGREMDGMAERLARARRERAVATEQLRHADRLTTVGRLASGVAHELGTPLAVVAGRAEMIATREVEDDEAVASARVILEQSTRMTAIIRQLLDFARRRGPQTARHDLRQIAAQTVAMVAPLGERRKVRVVLAPPEEGTGECVALVDAGQLQQVLTNLVVNAFDAMPGGGEVTVTVARSRATPPIELGGEADDYFAIAVRDQGAGIAPEALPHLFEPFFTTKDVGRGTGLGLSVSYGLVRDHGGWIDVATEPGRGSTFTVYVPVARESALLAAGARDAAG